MCEEFNWNDLDDGAIVVTQARTTAVYLGADGDVVIRHPRNWPHEEEDPFVFIPMHSVPALIARLHVLYKEAGASAAP